MPSVLEEHLWDITLEPCFRELADTKLSALLEKNPECRECEHLKKCYGGCLVQDMSEDGDYLIPDHRTCWFFKNIGDDGVRNIADEAISLFF
jgi:radical SAM protein with 4Fe4S-binding SPASM domain